MTKDVIKGILGLLAVFVVVTAIAYAAGRGQPRHRGDVRADRLRRRARVGPAQALTRCAALRTGSRSTREPAPPSATLARAVTRW